MKEILAWHFVGNTLRDGRTIPEDGTWLVYPGTISMCSQGYHASRNPFDALQYAPGPVLCRVALRGDIQEANDKLVASERMIICRMDATELLRYFARMQALSVIHLWDAPNIVCDYLMTGDDPRNAAAAVAARYAGAALSASTRDARRAARSAATGDARSAAWSAAWAAAWATRSAATGDAAKQEFTSFVNECFGIEEN